MRTFGILLLGLALSGCHVDEWLRGTDAAKGPCGPMGVSCKPYDGTNTCCPSYLPECRPGGCAASPYGVGAAAGDAGASELRPRTPAQ